MLKHEQLLMLLQSLGDIFPIAGHTFSFIQRWQPMFCQRKQTLFIELTKVKANEWEFLKASSCMTKKKKHVANCWNRRFYAAFWAG